MVSIGSAGPPVLSKKLNCVRHLRSLDAFSRLLVQIVSAVSALEELIYSAPPDSLAGAGGSLPPPQ